jgi:signal transduction histidine kinase/ligand-binding sensor domain-containing protein/CheY-like chemotaxis protein
MLRFVFLFVLLIKSSLVLTQQQQIRFRQLKTADGLSQSWVRCIYQDKLGYMWFGTDDGLNRFDGIDFKIYRYEPNNSKSIGNVSITSLTGKSDYELWIGTSKGVFIYEQKYDSFKSFPFLNQSVITSILTDQDKKTWFGTNNGLFCFNPADGKIASYYFDVSNKNSISNNTIRNIFQDSNGNIWVSTQHGLNLYLPSRNIFKRYFILEDIPSFNTEDFHSTIEDNFGRIWVGTNQGGLAYFQNASEQPNDGMFIEVAKGSVAELMIDRNNRIWVCNGSNLGLFIIDLNSYFPGKKVPILNIKVQPGVEGSLNENTIMSAYEDITGDVWLGTYGGGINYYSPRAKKFYSRRKSQVNTSTLSDNLINTFLEEEKYLWIGTESGLDRLDKSTQRFDHFYNSNDQANLSGSAIYALYKDTKQNLWYGSWAGGLNLYNPSTQNFTRFIADNKPGSISSSNVFSICEDSKGNLWIGTIGGGLNLYDYKTGKFSSFKHDPGNPESIYNDAINDILEASDGNLYISVYHSLEIFNPATGKFRHMTHLPDDPNSLNAGLINIIFQDSRSNIWVGTSMGLELLQKSGKFRHFTTEQGLPNNTIHGILEDDHGNLWISTNNGIAKFVRAVNLPDTIIIRNYSIQDGLSENEFIVRSAYKNEKGKMYFGSSNGYTFFYPDSIKDNMIAPLMRFTEFKLENGISNNIENARLLKDIIEKKEIKLNHNQTDFTIRYAALNYLNPSKNQYEYKLAGYEDHWHKVGNQRFASYTSIDPGSYTFIVRGSNNDDVWCEEPLYLKIIVLPPWWKTWIFRILLALTAIGLTAVLYNLRIRILEGQKKLLETKVLERTTELAEVNILLEERQEEITIQNDELSQHRYNLEQLITERTLELEGAKLKAEESDRLKSAFLANMSHEIRTPMNAIVGFSSLLEDETIKPQERQRFTQVIKNNSDTLLVLINDIIDISLIEADQLVLNKTAFSVENILIELEDYFQLRNEKPIKFSLDKASKTKHLILYNDQIRFRQVLTNLLSNAFKYSSSGSITFGYTIESDFVRFYVSDTGMGIAEKDQKTVFDYFRKIEHSDDKYYQGAGIGLTICKNLVEQMGGEIELQSKLNEGSTFYFTLPMSDNISFVPSRKQKNTTQYNLKQLNILIAEDDQTNFELADTILKLKGANIKRAHNGMEAVAHFRNLTSYKNWMVLMDIKMPLMDGIIACHEIKEISPSIPIIALTAFARPEDKYEIMKNKFDGYLSKPFDSVELLEIISKLFPT